MHSAPELASQVEMLRSPPQVYLRVRAMLDQPGLALNELAEVVASDPALTASVLRMANSALYGFRGQIDSVLRALQLLGAERVHGMVLAAALGVRFAGVHPSGIDVQAFWRNSLRCALFARALTRRQGGDADLMFVVGLLADIGHLVIAATVPDLAERARLQARQAAQPLFLAEREVIGCDFAEVGAALMNQWSVPEVFATLIGSQTRPRLAGPRGAAAAVLELARCLVEVCQRADGQGHEFEAALQDCLEASSSELLGGAGEDLLPLCVQVEEELQSWLSIFSLAQLA